ncbi:hypothetical protein KKH05_00935 [Patescibacteria group bacterium]|nr:hypothetical protein [Patescibacteria group bacterium]
MAHSIEIKTRAKSLRKKGSSLNEIYKSLGVSKGTLSIWLRDVKITDLAKRKIIKKIRAGRYKSAELRKKKTAAIVQGYRNKALQEYESIHLDKRISKLLCALIYYCEGNKNPRSGIRFTNSDPELMKSFLHLLRNSFELDEAKFRVCVHLHEYHDAAKQKQFWSNITEIQLDRFIKPHLKKNTGIRIRDGYQGCASLRYHDTNLARELLAIAKVFIKKGA